MKKLKLGFMASHGGSNMQAIINNIKSGNLSASAEFLISNNSNSGAIEKAVKEGLPYYHLSNKTFNDEEMKSRITSITMSYDIDLLILAGYMKKLPNEIIDLMDGKVLNIHPALLPKYGGKGMFGMNVHKAVIEANESETGATVHLVNEKYDDGMILKQEKVKISKDETPESLAKKVLSIEHQIYSQTIQEIAEGKIKLF